MKALKLSLGLFIWSNIALSNDVASCRTGTWAKEQADPCELIHAELARGISKSKDLTNRKIFALARNLEEAFLSSLTEDSILKAPITAGGDYIKYLAQLEQTAKEEGRYAQTLEWGASDVKILTCYAKGLVHLMEQLDEKKLKKFIGKYFFKRTSISNEFKYGIITTLIDKSSVASVKVSLGEAYLEYSSDSSFNQRVGDLGYLSDLLEVNDPKLVERVFLLIKQSLQKPHFISRENYPGEVSYFIYRMATKKEFNHYLTPTFLANLFSGPHQETLTKNLATSAYYFPTDTKRYMLERLVEAREQNSNSISRPKIIRLTQSVIESDYQKTTGEQKTKDLKNLLSRALQKPLEEDFYDDALSLVLSLSFDSALQSEMFELFVSNLSFEVSEDRYKSIKTGFYHMIKKSDNPTEILQTFNKIKRTSNVQKHYVTNSSSYKQLFEQGNLDYLEVDKLYRRDSGYKSNYSDILYHLDKIINIDNLGPERKRDLYAAYLKRSLEDKTSRFFEDLIRKTQSDTVVAELLAKTAADSEYKNIVPLERIKPGMFNDGQALLISKANPTSQFTKEYVESFSGRTTNWSDLTAKQKDYLTQLRDNPSVAQKVKDMIRRFEKEGELILKFEDHFNPRLSATPDDPTEGKKPENVKIERDY